MKKRIIYIATALVALTTSCEDEYVERIVNKKTNLELLTKAIEPTLLATGDNFAFVQFASTTKGEVCINGAYIDTLTYGQIKICNLEPKTEYQLSVRAMDGDTLKTFDKKFTTRSSLLTLIGITDCDYYGGERNVVSIEKTDDGKTIETIVLWEGGTAFRCRDANGTVLWKKKMDFRKIKSCNGKLIGIGNDKSATLLDPNTGNATMTFRATDEDATIDDAAVNSKGEMILVGSKLTNTAGDKYYHCYAEIFDQTGKHIKTHTLMETGDEGKYIGLHMANAKDDGGFVAAGSYYSSYPISLNISADGTTAALTKYDNEIYHNLEGNYGIGFVQYDKTMKDAEGNIYFCGTERVIWDMAYDRPSLMILDQAGELKDFVNFGFEFPLSACTAISESNNKILVGISDYYTDAIMVINKYGEIEKTVKLGYMPKMTDLRFQNATDEETVIASCEGGLIIRIDANGYLPGGEYWEE